MGREETSEGRKERVEAGAEEGVEADMNKEELEIDNQLLQEALDTVTAEWANERAARVKSDEVRKQLTEDMQATRPYWTDRLLIDRRDRIIQHLAASAALDANSEVTE